MYSKNCKYCSQNEDLKKIMIYICELSCSKLYLFREQSNLGRCVLAYDGHVNEFFDLSLEEAGRFAADMRKVGVAIKAAFGPDKINYGMFNDTGDHLHCHIVPKYRGGYQFNDMIVMFPDPGVYFYDDKYQEIIEQIRLHL